MVAGVGVHPLAGAHVGSGSGLVGMRLAVSACELLYMG
jgi:hypothetical protein